MSKGIPKKTQRVKIKIPLYSGYWTIILCDKLKPIEKEYGLNSLKGCNAVFFDKGNMSVIAFDINRIDAGIVAHECMHLINSIFECHGVIPDTSNDEHQAYLLKWAVNQVHKYHKKITGKRIN
jgi:hypothetical protein